MNDDLVKRLREGDRFEKVMSAEQAADRIEELEAKLKSETERLGREVNLARYGQPDFAWSIHVQAMAELEAKLAKAVAALEKMCVGEGWAAQIARTTLAELTGGKDE